MGEFSNYWMYYYGLFWWDCEGKLLESMIILFQKYWKNKLIFFAGNSYFWPKFNRKTWQKWPDFRWEYEISSLSEKLKKNKNTNMKSTFLAKFDHMKISNLLDFPREIKNFTKYSDFNEKTKKIQKTPDFRWDFEILIKITNFERISTELRLFSAKKIQIRVSWLTDSFDFEHFEKQRIFPQISPNSRVPQQNVGKCLIPSSHLSHFWRVSAEWTDFHCSRDDYKLILKEL